jgi:hypothetical protein
MAIYHVAGVGTASNMEGSCGYIEYAVADSQQGVVLQLWVWARCSQLRTVKSGFVANHEHMSRTWIDTLVRILRIGILRIGKGGRHL